MKLIPLTRGHFAQVDDEDFEELSKYKWHCQRTKTDGRFYAYRNGINENTGRKRSISMHRQIMGMPDRRIDIDHWDRDGLNNQRHNLRACSRSCNNGNAGLTGRNKSGFKGVSFDRARSLWIAGCGNMKAGRFTCRYEAARHYNKMAFDKWGEFARLNDVDPVFPN